MSFAEAESAESEHRKPETTEDERHGNPRVWQPRQAVQRPAAGTHIDIDFPFLKFSSIAVTRDQAEESAPRQLEQLWHPTDIQVAGFRRIK